jgi:hypothetical protein
MRLFRDLSVSVYRLLLARVPGHCEAASGYLEDMRQSLIRRLHCRGKEQCFRFGADRGLVWPQVLNKMCPTSPN